MKSVLANDLKLSPSELYVHDIAKMTNFYSDVVGLDILDKTNDFVILGHKHRPIIKLTKKPELKRASYTTAGLFHNAILYTSRAELAQVIYKILSNNPEYFTGTGDHLVSEAFYFNDPEGNGLELYFDRPKDEWKWENGRIMMDVLYIDPNQYIQKYLNDDRNYREDRKLGHVHLRVGNIAQAKNFYVDTLGFDVTFDMPSALFLSVGGYHHHIGANTWMSQGAGMRSPALGLAEFDINLPSNDDLEALSKRLIKREHDFKEKSGNIVTKDPWGNKIVFSSSK